MKISQYNWNWWFFMTCLIIVFGVMLSMTPEVKIGAILIVIGFVSLLPCLYVGLKPID